MMLYRGSSQTKTICAKKCNVCIHQILNQKEQKIERKNCLLELRNTNQKKLVMSNKAIPKDIAVNEERWMRNGKRKY